MQDSQNNTYKKYKEKYVFIKDIYNTIKSDIIIEGGRGKREITYAEFYSILEPFLQEAIDIIAKEQEVLQLPFKLGSLYLKRLPHKRPFHVRLDAKETTKQNKIILYKVPILDEEYTKLMWDRPYKYNKYKVLPLRRFKKIIKN